MLDHLKATYGFNKFRKKQDEIILELLAGRDVFTILPTGGGKSLLYQFPATFSGNITVVVSPLISLMNDQCMFLNSKNIPSVCLNSESCISTEVYQMYKIIYTTPEFITSRIESFQAIVNKIGLFAIDEAHCVSQWSHDFRPSYMCLDIIKKTFPNVPVLAVTATATPRVVDDIINLLGIQGVSTYSLGTRRTNLEIAVYPKQQFESCEFTDPTIIYVQTRKICEKVYDLLSAKGLKCGKYHGGMSKIDKDSNHSMFATGDILIIVATVSFGMGIDKSNIRHVINYGVPNDIETYYQEIGRAGRDGVMSRASLYYDPKDFFTAKYLIGLSKDPVQVDIKMTALSIFRAFLEEKNMCRQQILDYYFENGGYPTCEQVSKFFVCNQCDNCKGNHDTTDISTEAVVIISIIENHISTKGFGFGMEKTVSMIQAENNALLTKRSKVWIRELLQILVTKNILLRKQTQGGFVLSPSKKDISGMLPVIARLSVESEGRGENTHQGQICDELNEIRSSISKKYGIIQSIFMNDRVLGNIKKEKPRSISDLLKIDGISQDFISKYGEEFMSKYNKTHRNSFDDENSLVKQLKEYRTRVSKENRIPPYYVFHNSTMSEIAQKCPIDRESLLKIKGFGNSKLDKYGGDILQICALFKT